MDIDELKDEFGALSAPHGFNATNDIDKDQSASIINRLIRSDKKSKEILLIHFLRFI